MYQRSDGRSVCFPFKVFMMRILIRIIFVLILVTLEELPLLFTSKNWRPNAECIRRECKCCCRCLQSGGCLGPGYIVNDFLKILL